MPQFKPDEILDYHRVTASDTLARRRLSRQARGNGVGSLILCLCFFWPTTIFVTEFMPVSPSLTGLLIAASTLVLALNVMGHLACGVFYSIADIKISRPNPFWEQKLVTIGYVHVSIISSLVLISVFDTIVGLLLELPQATLGLISTCVNLVIIGSILQMVAQAKKVRNLGGEA